MPYPLINHFRGAFLGALLGDILASKRDIQQCQKHYFPYTMAMLGAESLIALGKLDVDDWQRRKLENLSVDTNFDIPSQTIIPTLPVMLFFHDNKTQLRQNLLNAIEIFPNASLIRDETLAVGYAIAQSLIKQLNPLTLIPEIISFIGETTTSLPHFLSKVNILLQSGAGLERVRKDLNREADHSNAVAIAFYCFLRTLEDFRLSVLGAVQIGNGLEGTAAITGALSGAYNSMVGIPVRYQQQYWQANMSEWQPSNLSQMLELTDALFFTWSGVYESNPRVSQIRDRVLANYRNCLSKEAIAAPGVIRSILP